MGSYIGAGKASRPREGFIPNPKLKLLDQVSEVMRFKHYSLRTETTYRECILILPPNCPSPRPSPHPMGRGWIGVRHGSFSLSPSDGERVGVRGRSGDSNEMRPTELIRP
jgi:hypothetical protein